MNPSAVDDAAADEAMAASSPYAASFEPPPALPPPREYADADADAYDDDDDDDEAVDDSPDILSDANVKNVTTSTPTFMKALQETGEQKSRANGEVYMKYALLDKWCIKIIENLKKNGFTITNKSRAKNMILSAVLRARRSTDIVSAVPALVVYADELDGEQICYLRR